MAQNLKYPNKSENRCAYKNCNNRRGDEGIVLFCFPNKTSNAEKYDKWCIHSGIDKEKAAWRMMLCNNHFRGEDYTTYEHQKLLPRAVPIDYRMVDTEHFPFDPTKVERVYSNTSFPKLLNINHSEQFPFEPEKVEKVYTNNSTTKMMNIIKSEITFDDDDDDDYDNSGSFILPD